MKHKVKILVRVGKKGAKKILKGNLNYRGKPLPRVVLHMTRYGLKFGPKALTTKIKQELVSIDRRVGNNLVFPNGLVTGVEPQAMLDWYKENGRRVTVVIPSYNDFGVLVPCVESIKETTDPKLVKVIIVDDYCQKESREFLKTLEDDQVSVIYREKNGGFAKAVNTGLKAADKKYDTVLINSDTIMHSGWIEALQFGAYEFGVDTGIVGPKLLYPDGRIQHAGAHRNTDVPEFFDHYYRFQDSNYGPANIPQYCMGVTGAAMYVKREFMNNVGILDEGFQFAFEDMDWCIRGWEAGYRTLYFPSAVITHVESATRAKNQTMSEKEKTSIEYFWKKWGDWFEKRNVLNSKGQRRIIFVLQAWGYSGGIKNIFEIANRLAGRNFAVEIWSIDRQPSPWETDPSIKLRSYKNFDRLSTALAKEEAIKVATWWETAFPVWLSSVIKGIPVYFISEFETWFYPDDLVAQSSVVSCYRREFRNITISSYNLDELKAIGLKATVIPCGYHDDIYRPLKNVEREDNVVLAVGRSFFQKNFPMTFEGWRLMGDKRPDMWLFGTEPELAKLDKKITYHTKPSNEGVNELYNKATIFVQTSRHEGFCLPVLEAMAAGCPVITTDSHGNRDFCFDGKNCLIVEQDDTEGLKRAIDKLMSDKKLRDKLAREALKTVKNFQWEVIANKAEKFFKEVK
jgi:GT2 family glycosyltransferase